MNKNKYICGFKNSILYGKKNLIALRQKIHELFYCYGISKKAIVRKERVSKKFVIRWTGSMKMDFQRDGRGWKKGKCRKLTMKIIERVRTIHQKLSSDKKNYFCGATAIATEWRNHYREQPPALRTIGMVLKKLGLSKGKRKKLKGASRYLCYPEHTIYHRLKGRVMEADFIGEKYLHGSSKPLHFVGFSCKQLPRLRYYQRVESQTATEFIRCCKILFERLEKPNYVKVDNCLAAIGSASGKRNISRTMAYLLGQQVIPIFAVPRKPFTQASIEGNNSVFSRKFWHRKEYESIAQIDKELKWFNASSLRYTGYDVHRNNGLNNHQAKGIPTTVWIPKIYFLRQVRQNHAGGYIDVLNETIALPSEYVNYYVLAEWNLKQQHLKVFFEKNKRAWKIHQQKFTINANSTKRMTALKEKQVRDKKGGNSLSVFPKKRKSPPRELSLFSAKSCLFGEVSNRTHAGKNYTKLKTIFN